MIIAVNDELEDSPENINDDAIENWICKVKILDKSALDELIDFNDYYDYTVTGEID